MSETKREIIGGNAIEVLRNGDEIFPAMLDAIRGARETICLETYVYWSGDIAVEFAEALADRARNGVRVHVLIDWYGSLRMKEKIIEIMKNGGVEVERFRPFRWFQLNFYRTNHRTHRKLLIVDGKVAFTGGVGIADEWTGNAQDPQHWRDNHFRILGPAVTSIQRAFFKNWRYADHDPPPGDDARYYPKLTTAGDADLEVVSASPINGCLSIYELFARSISEARTSLDIGSAYFVPGRSLMRALLEAAGRGVRIRILVCGKHTDEGVVRHASRAQWGRLLKAGIEIFEYRPTLYHVKSIIVDQREVSIGSANFDARSCRINDELNVTVHSPEFAKRQTEIFSEDCQNARKVTLEKWEERPLLKRALDWLSLLFRRQL